MVASPTKPQHRPLIVLCFAGSGGRGWQLVEQVEETLCLFAQKWAEGLGQGVLSHV